MLWDGADLYTKTGRAVPRGYDNDGAAIGVERLGFHTVNTETLFTRMLPPGVALMGELVTGRNTLGATTALARGGADVHNHWGSARLVAFDLPQLTGCVPYRTRHDLLTRPVATWTTYVLRVRRGIESPLMVTVQFELGRLPTIFREVVEGVPWERRTPTYGTPVYGPRGGLTLRSRGLFPEGRASSGEGLMLWRQDARGGEGRGLQGHSTRNVLKYKPTMIIPAVVEMRPVHALSGQRRAGRLRRQREGGGDPPEPVGGAEGGTAAGYTVGVRAWDPVRGDWLLLRRHVSPWYTPEAVTQHFAVGSTVFVVFVAFSRYRMGGAFGGGPQYMYATPRVDEGTALAMVRHALVNRGTLPAGVRPGERTDTLRWELDEMGAVFPADVVWSPLRHCINAVPLCHVPSGAALPRGERRWASVGRKRRRPAGTGGAGDDDDDASESGDGDDDTAGEPDRRDTRPVLGAMRALPAAWLRQRGTQCAPRWARMLVVLAVVVDRWRGPLVDHAERDGWVDPGTEPGTGAGVVPPFRLPRNVDRTGSSSTWPSQWGPLSVQPPRRTDR